TGRDEAVGAGQEVGDLAGGGLEVGLAERGGQLDVQDLPGRAALGFGGGPHADVAQPLARLDAGGEQVAGEDPLDRLVQADVEGDADRVGVVAGVVQA